MKLKRPPYLYHSTPVENVEAILRDGLKPSGLGIVYLSEKPDTWARPGNEVLRVDILNIGLRLSTFNDPRLDEILCWGRITPDRISRINEVKTMTIKELKDTLAQYPDDARIVARVIARNGRGGTFEEKLLLSDSHHEEEDNTVYLNCGFEIGWLNAHPEFWPPAEPETMTDDEARDMIFADLGAALGHVVNPEQTLTGLTLDEVKSVLETCDHLVGNGNKSPDNTASRTPGTHERLLSLGTFGNLVDYMLGYCGCEPETRVLVPCSCGDAPELRTGVDGKYAYVCPNCGRAGAITDTQEQAAVLWNSAFGAGRNESGGPA